MDLLKLNWDLEMDKHKAFLWSDKIDKQLFCHTLE